MNVAQWFGSEVYRVAGSVVLTSGREKPAQGDVKRGEVAVIVLTDWQVAGRQWKV